MTTLTSPCKLNLFLKIINKCPQTGYHYLNSLFVLHHDLHDTITVQESHTTQITCNKPITGTNILTKCLSLVQQKGLNVHFNIHITKNIPIGAGLGGGSSNAGTFLRYLTTTYNIAFTPQELVKIGADVAFFYYGYNIAFCSGFGEIVEPVTLDFKYKLHLTHPDIHISTPTIYKNFKLQHPYSNPKHFYKPQYTLNDIQSLENDLQPVVASLHPQITKVLAQLKTSNTFDVTRMSGSGSTCFGLTKI